MMTLLYVTADQVGRPNHGAGSVTYHESEALKELGPAEVWGREQIISTGETYTEPWGWDDVAWCKRDFFVNPPKLAHFYAGTFSRTVAEIRKNGGRVSYTAAAHDVEKSRREHELLGVRFDLPHLTDPALWERYVRGYREADVVVCPSTHSKACMESYGCKNVVVIPHGVELPEKVRPLPERFTVGYLGAIGPDKGLRYLIEAWGNLNYRDATLLIAGRDSTHPLVQMMIQRWGFSANFELLGWVDDVADFYARCSLYVQPSVTEGFGIEVLEAMAHGRGVLCSTGAGAADLVPEWSRFPPADPAALAEMIDHRKKMNWLNAEQGSSFGRSWELEQAGKHTWDKVREQYKQLWRGMLK
jgi:glycosyltransferase involved in cell wall biosynthesis